MRLDTVGHSWTEVSRLPLAPSSEAQMDKALGTLEQEKCQFHIFIRSFSSFTFSWQILKDCVLQLMGLASWSGLTFAYLSLSE